MDKYVLIVAGGKGLRMGGDLPKQFIPMRGKRIKRGAKESTSAAKSGLSPFFRPFHVSSGKSDTTSSQNTAEVSAVIVKTAFGASSVAVNVCLYRFHSYSGAT